MNDIALLNAHLDGKRDTLKSLAAKSGVHWVTICKIRKGKNYTRDTFDKLRPHLYPAPPTPGGTGEAA